METHHFIFHSSGVRAARTHYQTTGCYDQAPAVNWDLAVSWGRGVWVSLAIALGSGWPTVIETQTKTRNQPTGYYHQAPGMNWSAGVGGSALALAIALWPGCPSGIETQTKCKYQLTGYQAQAPAMKRDLAVSWGRGVWVRIGLANRNRKTGEGVS